MDRFRQLPVRVQRILLTLLLFFVLFQLVSRLPGANYFSMAGWRWVASAPLGTIALAPSASSVTFQVYAIDDDGQLVIYRHDYTGEWTEHTASLEQADWWDDNPGRLKSPWWRGRVVDSATATTRTPHGGCHYSMALMANQHILMRSDCRDALSGIIPMAQFLCLSVPLGGLLMVSLGKIWRQPAVTRKRND